MSEESCMAGLKFFVSSTCYDLSEERNQLRNLIKNLGHEPILSDHNEILYDYDEHTHLSCVREIPNADIVILIIGSRYGGKAINETTKLINFEEIQKQIHGDSLNIEDIFSRIKEEKKLEKSKEAESNALYKAKSIGFSITHFEILKAIEQHIPIYVFIKDKVANFYDFFIQNKDNNPELTFPEFSTYETKYLAEFISILKRRRTNNSIFEFNSYLDIETQLKQQLALKFRSLLINERNKNKEFNEQRSQVDMLTQQFEDLKTAILSTLPRGQEKTVAKGVLKYRRVLSTLSYLLTITKFYTEANIINLLANFEGDFEDFLRKECSVREIFYGDGSEQYVDVFTKLKRSVSAFGSFPVICDRDDDLFYFRNSHIFKKMIIDWSEFLQLENEIKKLILDALLEEDLLMQQTIDVRILNENFKSFIIRSRHEDFIKRKDLTENEGS